MNALRLLCLFSISCLVSTSVSARQSTSSAAPPVTSDPQAVALIQSALAAVTRGVPVSDVTLTGTADRVAGSDNESGTATLSATSVGDSRINLNFPSGQRTEIRNHAALPLADSVAPGVPAAAVEGQTQTMQPAGSWSGPDGVPHGMPNHNLATDAAWFFPAATLVRIAALQGYIFVFFGEETHNGQPAIHVSVSQPPSPSYDYSPPIAALMQHLSQMDFYLDPTTLLPMALAFNIHPDNNAACDLPAEIRFSGYQTKGGVQIPFHVQKYVNNGLVLDLQFSSAVLNSGLLAATFDLQ
jgi:hypothetical protein